MNIKEYANENTIFIMPNNIKNELLKHNNTLLNIKAYTKEELQKKIMFDYNEKALHYLHKKYNYKIDICKMYLNNIYYINNLDYKNSKLNKLVSIKQELTNNNLLIFDNIFLHSLKNKRVIVYGYDYIDKFFRVLLDNISTYAEVKIINNTNSFNNHFDVYEFNDIEDEINYVAYSICDLIDKGIDINNIKISNINEEYKIPLKRIFSFYNIPINLNDNISLYGTDIVLTFLNMLNDTKNIQDILDKLGSIYDLNDSNNLNIYNKIVNISNRYTWCNDDYRDMLINDFKHTYLSDTRLDKEIEIIDFKNNIIGEDKYIFLMNFNQGSMPIIYQDEDYITDDLSKLLDLEETVEKNTIEKSICKNIINNIKNITITYKLKSKTSEYYPSSLIDELEMNVIKNIKMNITKSYSKLQDEFNLSKKLDKLTKYEIIDDDIDILFSNYPDILYKSYDNKFNGIDNSSLLKYLNSKLKLSYSSLDDYFKCAFKYYINHVMKLKKKEVAFHLTIGNLFHYVLSSSFKDNFNFDKTWNEYLKDAKLSSKEEFFLTKLKDELSFVIKTINMYNSLSTFDKSLYEEGIYINLNNKINVTFSGIVDKIMYKEGNPDLISIIDYKTGNTDINLNNVIHGLNMQLPIYLYLVTNSHKFNNPKFVGFYLQEILHNEIYNDFKTDYETQKQDALKLKGYTIDNEDLIKEFDQSYVDSRVIKSMKISKNGFYAYSKILNEKQMNNLVTLVGNKIDEASTNIIDGHFDINPKRLGSTNVSCEYCEFRDICYMKDSDIVTLKEYKNIDFLGGEEND